MISIVGLFAIFMMAGPFLIMSNKFILSSVGFHFPLSLSLITLLFTWFACWAYVKISGNKWKHQQTLNYDFYVYNVLPIGALSACTIVLGMASYLYLTVSFIQMLKAFTPVMTMIGLVMFRLDSPSQNAMLCVLMISFGTAVAGYGELNFSIVGVLCMLSAQVAEAMKLVYTQVVLTKGKLGVFETVYYVTPASAACVFLCAFVMEFPKMTYEDVMLIYDNKFIFLNSCILAILTQTINTVVIQYSSALVLKLTATARNALLILFNAMVLGEIVSFGQIFGYIISIFGFGMYNYVKSNKL